ncbi:hypothetical protein GCM10011391_18470 [Pullulanibacillus camelliae]|uniref:Ferrous iron transporter B n=1 Tax=Pullulanibacillus camelliae TaxID=1707096 RepID=A0A8J2VUB0_9BACL|nr:GTPase [Pullulanibacillus camelliae]GGE39952.1 hypothetical protein GCM10011391_18470 [Pullulanibacillus camelliae]
MLEELAFKQNQSGTVVMIGLESVGKSTLFRHLTGNRSGIVTNIRGSTVSCLTGPLMNDESTMIIDTPGIQFEGDSLTTKLALEQANKADTLLLVIKATDYKEELMTLNTMLHLRNRHVAIAITYCDKCLHSHQERQQISELLDVPVMWLNAREVEATHQQQLIEGIQHAKPWKLNNHLLTFLPILPVKTTSRFKQSWYTLPLIGPWLSLGTILAMFAVPVYIAYQFAQWMEPLSEKYGIQGIETFFHPFPTIIQQFLVGDYGLITLGWYSFLWAFPVVFLIGVTTAISEETGIQEHITISLDPWLRRIGLTGRDLIPVLTGFGCNVVAVLQSRSCSSCTRQSCVSLISFGSACSYQIGATLSLFGSAHKPWLFIPYIFVLFIVGAIHTRLWNKNDTTISLNRITSLPYLQSLTWYGLIWRVKNILKQFLLQAMPIFFIICGVATALEYTHVLGAIAVLISPVLHFFNLPPTVAPGIVFSFIRKDGLLVLNQGHGEVLSTLTVMQIFILVYLASTLSSCLVTLYTLKKEWGWVAAGRLFAKQFFTSVISAYLISALIYFFK